MYCSAKNNSAFLSVISKLKNIPKNNFYEKLKEKNSILGRDLNPGL